MGCFEVGKRYKSNANYGHYAFEYVCTGRTRYFVKLYDTVLHNEFRRKAKLYEEPLSGEYVDISRDEILPARPMEV